MLESLSVADVRNILDQHELQVQELTADTSTAASAAQALGTTVDAIVKSLLFIAGEDPILILAPGDRKVSRDRLRDLTRAENVRLAKPDEVLRITGYAVGGVPPVAHRQATRILMDRHLFEQAIIYAAAGASNAIFAVEPNLLKQLTDAEIVEVTD